MACDHIRSYAVSRIQKYWQIYLNLRVPFMHSFIIIQCNNHLITFWIAYYRPHNWVFRSQSLAQLSSYITPIEGAVNEQSGPSDRHHNEQGANNGEVSLHTPVEEYNGLTETVPECCSMIFWPTICCGIQAKEKEGRGYIYLATWDEMKWTVLRVLFILPSVCPFMCAFWTSVCWIHSCCGEDSYVSASILWAVQWMRWNGKTEKLTHCLQY